MFRYIKLQYTKLKKRREYKRFFSDDNRCIYNGTFKINDDLSVDLDRHIGIYGDIPMKLNSVLSITLHKEFTTSHNLPNIVTQDFSAKYCNLKSLINFPKHIGRHLDISNNNIENLDYFPEYIGGNCWIDNNNISLVDKELNVMGRVSLTFNPLKKITISKSNLSLYFTKISDFCHTLRHFGLTTKLCSDNELFERVNEFDIISDDFDVDILRLEDLFHFYSIDIKNSSYSVLDSKMYNVRYIQTLGYTIK